MTNGTATQRIIGENVRLFRHRQNLTQEQLATMIGKTSTHVGLIERGERAPSMSTLEDLADSLGTEPYDLLRRRA